MEFNNNKVLVVENLRKTYSDSQKKIVAVNDVSFSLAKGEILALLGANGAGKTTTIKMISGLLEPDSGAVRIAGYDPHREREALRHIGSVLEGNRSLYWRMTSRENLIYFGVLKGMTIKDARARSIYLLKKFFLESKEKVQVQKLSRGMQQRLSIAVSMMHHPSLLLLDEPTLGLDLESTIDVKNTIRELVDRKEIGVVLTTHQLDIAEELSNWVVMMKSGKIINSGVTQDLVKSYATNVYELKMIEPVSEDIGLSLHRIADVSVSEDKVLVRGGSSELYRVIAALDPLEIHSIRRLDSDLGSVFLKITSMECPQSA